MKMFLNHIQGRNWIGLVTYLNKFSSSWCYWGADDEVKGVGRRTHLLDDLKKKKKILGAKGGSESDGNDGLSVDHKEEIPIIVHKTIDLPISSVLNNSNIISLRQSIFIHLVKQLGN